jgi:hypothetical protein
MHPPQVIPGVQSMFRDTCDQMIKFSRSAVTKANHFLEQVAYGGTGGSHWYDGFKQEPEALLTYFKETLATVDMGQISRYTRAVEEVYGRMGLCMAA